MIRLRVSGIVAKIPYVKDQILLDGNYILLLKYREVNGWASEDSILEEFLMTQCQDQFYPFEELFE